MIAFDCQTVCSNRVNLEHFETFLFSVAFLLLLIFATRGFGLDLSFIGISFEPTELTKLVQHEDRRFTRNKNKYFAKPIFV